MQDFQSPNGKVYSSEDLIKEILSYIRFYSQDTCRVIIGTDSANHDTTDFVNAIVIYRVGHGGRFFWRRMKKKKTSNLRQRIYKEVLLSLQLAQTILTRLSQEKDINFEFEVHVDIGSKGKTKEMLQEIIGMVKGSGFHVKTKPESFGASKVADRYT